MSTSIVLVCAVLASMAAGVLLAYGVCVAIFALFDSRVKRLAPNRVPSVSVSNPVAEI